MIINWVRHNGLVLKKWAFCSFLRTKITNFHSVEMIPQVGFKKNFRLPNYDNAKKASTVYHKTKKSHINYKLYDKILNNLMKTLHIY